MPLRAAALFTALILFTNLTMSKTSVLYIATQNPEKMGIAVAQFDASTGTLSAPQLIQETRDPAHFDVTPDGRHLYMCNTGTPGGVSAFAITDRRTGALELLNYRESKGRGPSYVSVDASGRFVLEANYGGGYVEVYSLAKDGSLDAQTAAVEFTGSSVHPQRQTKPYAHWFRTDPSGRFALAADLGTDRIMVFRFDARTGALTPNDPPSVKVAGGMGPRHLAFHPSAKWVYAIAEMGNQVMAFHWDAARGVLTEFQSVPTLDAAFTGANTAAEIAVHPNGRFLYMSNRGEDSLVVFAIDAATGALTFKQRVSSRGRTPRYFAFDATHRWLVVSNQDGGNLAVFRVDEKSGELAPVGEPVPITKPMGVKWGHS